jgi:hypothetical protein
LVEGCHIMQLVIVCDRYSLVECHHIMQLVIIWYNLAEGCVTP